MSLCKRMISCVLVFVMCFSFSFMPASATAGDAVDYLIDGAWDWFTLKPLRNLVSTFLAPGKTPETATEQDWKDAYNDYVTNVQTNVGTATVIDGGIRMYFKPSDKSFTYVTDAGSRISDTYFYYCGVGNQYWNQTVKGCNLNVYFNNPIKVPFSAFCSTGYFVSGVNWGVAPLSGQSLYKNMSLSAGSSLYAFNASGASWRFVQVYFLYQQVNSGHVIAYADLKPTSGVVGDYYNVDISNNSRVGSITGDFGIIGDNNQIIKSDKNYIVNETTNNYYNPATGLEKPILNWSYDYGDRSYTLQLEGNVTSKVVFGDENVTIKEGDTIYNIYYITEKPVDPSSSPSPHVHSYTPAVTKEPTCLAPGVRTYTCSVCGSSYTETIPAAGHKWNPHTTVNTEYNEDGTVKQEGYTIWKCSVCGEEYKSSNTTGPPSGGGADGGGGGGIFKDIFGIFVDFIGFFSGLFKDFVAGGIKEFIKALTDPVSDIFGILNPFNWFD